MLRLKNRDLVVPEDGEGRNFRFLHPETRHWSEASDYYTWSERIRLHRKANGLREISMAEAEEQLCKGLPAGWCSQDRDDTASSVDARVSFSQVVDAMKVFASWALTGFKPVEKDEAERRARVCTGCYLNVGVSGCGICAGLSKLITGIFSQLKTSEDPRLKVCAVCRCMNRAQVWVPLDALESKDSTDKQAAYPNFCWLKKAA